MRDNNLLFRNTTDSLTATATSSWLDLAGGGTVGNAGPNGLVAVVNIPKQSIGDTVAAKLQFSSDGSNAKTDEEVELFLVASVTAAVTTPVQYRKPFRSKYRYVRLELTVAGTSPDYGAVNAHLEHGLQDNVLTLQ